MNTDKIKITLVQYDIAWHNGTANLNFLNDFLDKNISETDIIVLPEMFTTGFTMHPESQAETEDGTALAWMRQTAKKYNSAVCGSLCFTENKTYFNRMFFVYPNGDYAYYDKRHLFSFAKENKHYKAGKRKQIVHYKGFSILLQVCYDLRFPIFSRYTTAEAYDIILYVANWPSIRISAWDALLRARAVENLCYTIGVNRVGTDANNMEYNGHSSLYNMLGEQLYMSETQSCTTLALDKKEIETSRCKFQFLYDADKFSLEQ